MSEQMNASRARAAQSMTSEAHQTAARLTPAPRPAQGARYACSSQLTGRQFDVVALEVREHGVYVRDDSRQETYFWNPQNWQQYVMRRIA